MSATNNSSSLRLSICIATFNRSKFIAQLLESIVGQAVECCEVIVSDNASTDDTDEVVAEFARRNERIRYFKQATNVGLDRNFDNAVTVARGDYCWLMADDDLLKPGAIICALEALRKDFSLVVVNYERATLDLSHVTLARHLDIDENCVYTPEDLDRLFVETANHLVFIGAMIIRREVWLARNRARHHGSFLTHLAVIFQAKLPCDTLLIATPLVVLRDGNVRTFWSDMFEIFMIKLPEVIWSMAPSESAKAKVTSKEPWREIGKLVFQRAMGFYGLNEYREWIRPKIRSAWEMLIPVLVAVAPGVLVNLSLVCYYKIARSRFRDVTLLWLRQSRFYFRKARFP
jgi:glycosyltransferase involved in cell wall biosynthesis